MSQKACKVLQMIAFILFAFALLLSIVSIFAQNLIKGIYSLSSDLYGIRVIPYEAIIRCFLLAIFSLISFLVISARPGRKGTITITVVISVLYVFFATVVFSLINVLVQSLTANMGSAYLAAYSVVQSGVNLIVSFFVTPATLLMFLSLGGACGKDFRSQF